MVFYHAIKCFYQLIFTLNVKLYIKHTQHDLNDEYSDAEIS